ncbi:MAG: hypothetical protein GXN99_02665, partial [Candidatus Nanohaloarchaeota archaeon]|nr:hypothetical protein [Candidatus Nanohaloarchaeota archaeon]
MTALTPLEHKILQYLKEKEKAKIAEIAEALKEDQSRIVRAILKLKEKELADMWEQDEVLITLTKEGKKALESLPEENLVNYLKKHPNTHIKDIIIPQKEIAIAWAKNKGAITIDKGILKLQNPEIDLREKDLLRQIEHGKKINEKDIEHLRKRKFVQIEAKTITYAKITEKGKKERYDDVFYMRIR